MGTRTVAALAAAELSTSTWSKVHVWWGDERFVPESHPDRNDQHARDAGLDALPVPGANIHPAPAGSTEEELPAAAATWARELGMHAPEGEQTPRFDVVLLGMGPDAHVASLFPDRAELTVTDQSTVAVTDSPNRRPCASRSQCRPCAPPSVSGWSSPARIRPRPSWQPEPRRTTRLCPRPGSTAPARRSGGSTRPLLRV